MCTVKQLFCYAPKRRNINMALWNAALSKHMHTTPVVCPMNMQCLGGNYTNPFMCPYNGRASDPPLKLSATETQTHSPCTERTHARTSRITSSRVSFKQPTKSITFQPLSHSTRVLILSAHSHPRLLYAFTVVCIMCPLLLCRHRLCGELSLCARSYALSSSDRRRSSFQQTLTKIFSMCKRSHENRTDRLRQDGKTKQFSRNAHGEQMRRVLIRIVSDVPNSENNIT